MKSTLQKRTISEPVDLSLTQEMIDEMANAEKIPAKLRKQIIKDAEDTARHYADRKWDLDYDYLISDLKSQLLGFNPEWLYLQVLLKKAKKQFYIHDPLHRTVLSLKKENKKALSTFTVGKVHPKKKKKVRK